MLNNEKAKLIAVAVAKVVARFVADEVGGKYLALGVDLIAEASEILLDDEKRKPGHDNDRTSPADVVTVMRSLSPRDISRSVDAALASPEISRITASMSPGKKEQFKRRTVAEMSAFDRVYREMDEKAAREAANRLEKKLKEKEEERRERENRVAPLKKQLLERLQAQELHAAQAIVDDILEIDPYDRDALGADLRIRRQIKSEKHVRAFASSGALFMFFVIFIFTQSFSKGPMPFSAFAFAAVIAVVIGCTSSYVVWPLVRWWRLRQR